MRVARPSSRHSASIVNVVCGATVSTVTVTDETDDTLPAASVAVTEYVCAPSTTSCSARAHAPPTQAVTSRRALGRAFGDRATVAPPSAVPDTFHRPGSFCNAPIGAIVRRSPAA